MTAATEPLMPMREAAVLIGMSYEWLRKEVKARRVPFFGFGRSVRFSREQVEEIKAAHLKQPTARLRVVTPEPSATGPKPKPTPRPKPRPPRPTKTSSVAVGA